MRHSSKRQLFEINKAHGSKLTSLNITRSSGTSRFLRYRKQDVGLRTFIAVAAVWLTIGSLQAGSKRPATANSDDAFFVGSHGWHTSIIVPRRKISAGAWPRVAAETFARFDYLEIGWGDRKFYTAPKPNVAMALDAVFSPGPSVLHIVGLDPPVARALAWSALVRVPCTTRQMAALCRALGDSFDRDTHGDAIALGSGLYGATSRFYEARGRYYLFNTCDTWTARMMQAGGLRADTSPAGTWSAGAVMAQARRLAARTKRKFSMNDVSAGTCKTHARR